MAQLDAEAVIKRSDKAWAKKQPWNDLRRSAYELALPMRNVYDDIGSTGSQRGMQQGRRKMNNVFDSTLQVATVRFANRLQTELMPPFQKWAKLVPGALVPKVKRQEIMKSLEGIRETMFAAMQVSNFDTAINEFFLDLSIGTAVMLVQEGDDDMPVRYEAVPQAFVAFEEGAFGAMDGLYRRMTIAARLVEEKWRKFDPSMPERWAKMCEDEPDKEVDLIEATYFDYDDKVWRYEVIWHGSENNSTKKTAHRLVDREMDESPWIVGRWIKSPGEIEGRGPVLFALPDAKTLNKLKELVLMNASLQVSGVWTAVDDGVINTATVRIVPGAVIPVARNGGALGATLQQLPVGGNFDVSQILADDLIGSINSIMMASRLPPEEGPIRSATEIAARMQELSMDIGSPFGRLMTEVVRPVVEKTLNVLGRMKIIPMPQGQRIKVNGGFVDVKVTTPIALAQNLSEVQTALQWASMVQTLGSEVAMIGINVEEVPAWLAEKMGVDPMLVRTPQQRQEAMQQAMAMQAANGNIPTDGGGVSAAEGGAIPLAA